MEVIKIKPTILKYNNKSMIPINNTERVETFNSRENESQKVQKIKKRRRMELNGLPIFPINRLSDLKIRK